MGVVISKPDKPLWPTAESYTKLELAQYLEKVGPWMIAHFGRLTQFCLRRF
jgi:bifunctional non-homologous end joining protein LigD